MVIQHNIKSINAHRQLGVNNTNLSKKLEKLSSGYRINVAADDAAGLAISEKMRAQITGLSRAVLNAHDGVSLVQTAEGALQEVHAQLNRLEEMAVQAANGIYAADDRQKLQAETDALLKEFDRISEAANFNGINLLDGSLSKHKTIANAAIAQAPPPYATPIALAATGAFGVDEAMGIQPLSGDIMPLALVTIDFDSLTTTDAAGNGWSYSAAGGGVLTITGDNSYTISSASGAQTTKRIVVQSDTNAGITLNNVNISTNTGAALDMRSATVALNITGTNTLTATGYGAAGIQTTGGNLTIDGTGSLTATGGEHGAGIGGGDGGDGGIITINGGTITATGGVTAAGIGGGFEGTSGIISIHGGTVTAKGGNNAAGIGGGEKKSAETITISNGFVTATGGSGGAGIGGGSLGSGGIVTISGGIVQANGGGYSAGIGGGGTTLRGTACGAGATLLISGGVVMCDGGVGGGYNTADRNYGADGTTTITGGNLTVDNPKDDFRGSLIAGSSNDYFVEIQGIAFGAYETVNYVFNSVAHSAVTDKDGRLFLYLPQSANGGTFTMHHDGIDYSLLARVKTDHSGYIRFDETAPTIQAGAANRVNKSTGTVKFTPSEAGEYYYAVVEAGTGEPFINTNVTGITCNTNEQTINLTSLTGDGAKDVYVVMKDEVGNLSSMVKIELPGGDWTAPTVTPGAAERTAETTGTVAFDSSEAGTYYYLVKEADDATPVSVNDIKGGTSGVCTSGGNSINLTGLTGSSAKTVYLVVEDGAGNVSGIQQIGLDAFVPKYEVEITLPEDIDLPPNTDITVNINGEDKTVTTDNDGKLVVELPDGKHEIEISHGGKDYTGTITVDGGDTSVELVEYVPPPPPPPAKGLVLQIGDTADEYNKLTVYIEGASAAHLGLEGLSLETQEAASAALSKIRGAIERVSVNRGQLGAYQNRLEHTINNLNNTVENMTAAESRIRDADMASEMMEFTMYNVLAQAAQAMLAQANQQPQQVMQLLR